MRAMSPKSATAKKPAPVRLPLDEPIIAAKKYYELTPDQIKAAFARQLRLDDFVQVVRGPAPQ